MDALDRLIAREVVRCSAPSRPVDDLAIFTAATTQSRPWRFGSMFSATKYVVAGVIVALFGGLLLTGVLTQNGQEEAPVVGASASAERETEQTARPVVTDVIDLGGGAVTDLLETADAVWVAWRGPDMPATVARIDKATREVTDRISLEVPAGYPRLVATDDAVWVADIESASLPAGIDRPNLFRIDPVTRTVTDTLFVGDVLMPAWAELIAPIDADGSIWLWAQPEQEGGRPRLIEIDIATRQVRAEHVPPEGMVTAPLFVVTDMTVRDETIWTAVGGVLSFDLASRQFGDYVRMESGRAGYYRLYAFDDAIVLEDDNSVWGWMDPATFERTGEHRATGYPVRSTSAPGAIWAGVNHDGPSVLRRIDVGTQRFTARIEVSGEPMFPAYSDGLLWVPFEGGRVDRIDTEAREVTHSLRTGVRPLERAYAFDDAVWIIGDGKVVRIATEATTEQ